MKLALRFAAIVFAAQIGIAQAHTPNASDASTLSLLPVAVSVAAPALFVSAGATLSVVALEASGRGTVLVLERASDGARASIRFAGGVVVSVGSAIAVTAIASGWILSTAGKAIAFIPNEIGAALLFNERVTP